MKLENNYNKSLNFKTSTIKSKPNFKGYYTPAKLREFEALVKEYSVKNPYLTGTDINKMRASIKSFNAFYKGTKTLSPDRISNELYHKFGIPSDFKGDKFVAGCSALTANIFHRLHLPQPSALSKKRLESGVLGSCNPQNRNVSFAFDTNWENVQDETIIAKLLNHSSSGHFLKTFIHEFMHSVHVSNLHKLGQQAVNGILPNGQRIQFLQQNPAMVSRALNEGAVPFTQGSAKKYVMQKVSTYGSSKPVEMYAEIGTEMITDVLDTKNLLPKNNPFVFKNFTQDKFLMGMMDDFWNGNFEKYIRT